MISNINIINNRLILFSGDIEPFGPKQNTIFIFRNREKSYDLYDCKQQYWSIKLRIIFDTNFLY